MFYILSNLSAASIRIESNSKRILGYVDAQIEHPRRDPVYDAADISAYARKLLFDVALDMFGNLWDNYVTYEIDSVEEHEDSLEDSLDKKVSSDVTYENLYIYKEERA